MANAHHEVANNPVKEISFALIGTVLFLAMVVWIAVAAYMRPAGDHHTAESLVATQKEQTGTDTATPASEVASAVAVDDRQDVNAEASAQLDNATVVDESQATSNADSSEVDPAMGGTAQAGVAVVPNDATADTAEAPAQDTTAQ